MAQETPIQPTKEHLTAAHVVLLDDENYYRVAHSITHIPIAVWEECERRADERLRDFIQPKEWVALANIDYSCPKNCTIDYVFGYFYLRRNKKGNGWTRIIFLREQYAGGGQPRPHYSLERVVNDLF